VQDPVLIASESDASKVNDAISETQQITIEAWVRPANLTQAGPARIVSVSKDTGQRNFTLGQKATEYEVRFRTAKTSANGEPALASRGSDHTSRHISASRSENGELAVIYCPVGDEIVIRPGLLKESLMAEWFNPRSGERLEARPQVGNRYRTPNDNDWLLLFR